MSSKQKRFRVAILDDYQNVALSLADWSVLDGGATVTVFNDHLADADAVIERLQPFEIVCVMRERTPMTRSIIDRAFKPLRYDALMRLRRRQAVRICAAAVGAILFFARGLVATLLRCGQAIEARRVRAHLLELDDHLLSDVGLTRAEVRFGNIATVIRQSHRPAEFAHQSRGHRRVGEKR
jgi:uncharacterized protein YjiS (DUF1127 family)